MNRNRRKRTYAETIVLDVEQEEGAKKGDPHCYECKVKYRDPSEKDLIMYLHALRYQVWGERYKLEQSILVTNLTFLCQGKDWSYETELPSWADANWSGHCPQWRDTNMITKQLPWETRGNYQVTLLSQLSDVTPKTKYKRSNSHYT